MGCCGEIETFCQICQKKTELHTRKNELTGHYHAVLECSNDGCKHVTYQNGLIVVMSKLLNRGDK